ncbi:TPA: Crp/Fnr family transcriptional regulator [Candidatus Saccharibacteria bacterium]|nr:Crp/Fnr family transcriptional regulator [Candidatus Saccharibacteria bacterium]HIO87325.1 Crp/Fnr family transcriptional regulator [Candidatus Saccharibacteria bacterium]
MADAPDVKHTVRQFFSQFPARSFDAKHILLHPHKRPDYCYYIEHGEVRQYFIDPKGNEVVVNIFKPSAFLPMSYILTTAENTFFFETTVPTKLQAAPADDIADFIKTNPAVMFDLLQRVFSGLNGVLGRLVHVMSSNAFSILVNELITQAHRQHADSDTILLPIKEYQIATYCGLTKETVSREMQKLKKQNLVSVSSEGITIQSLKKLEDQLEQF